MASVRKSIKLHVVRGQMNYNKQRAKQIQHRIDKLETKKSAYVDRAETRELQLLEMEEHLTRIINEREQEVRRARRALDRVRRMRKSATEVVVDTTIEPELASV